MKTQEKIDNICKKYGNKTFCYLPEDLEIFTGPELQYLCDNGLIYEDHYRKELLWRGIK